MSIKIIIESLKAEKSSNYHIIRLLILLSSLKDGKSIAGLTKLAKLDFLLRYPNCLERALNKINYQKNIQISQIEKNTIETTMIKYNYGPWDKRYRFWISIMQAKDLISVFTKGKTVYISINDNGRKLVSDLYKKPVFATYFERSNVIIKKFNSLSSKKMLELIYDVFPELSTMRSGEEIII
ncbi:MAG: hypothetical protein GY756_15555 [bacterium]|nr:hypothetical protein [bacterium]